MAAASIKVPMIVKLEDNYPTNPTTIQLIMIVLVSVVFGMSVLIAFLLVPCAGSYLFQR